LLNKITRIEGVSGVRSSFVMRRVIDTTVLPLGASLDAFEMHPRLFVLVRGA